MKHWEGKIDYIRSSLDLSELYKRYPTARYISEVNEHGDYL